jgi:hypothetical protein
VGVPAVVSDPRPWPTWTPGELDRLRLLWRDRVPIADVAAALERSPAAVQTRARMVGLPSRRLSWSRAEEFRLLELLEAHHPYADIARILGRTEQAVRDRCAQHLGAAMTRANGRSVSATARLLGVESKTVAWWTREGWLRATAPITRLGRGQLRLVEEDDLMAFLGDEAHWHLWEPARITDIALRDWATEQRRGLTFLTARQAGQVLGLSHHRVNQLINRGRLRAVRRGGPGAAVRRRATVRPLGGNWLIRSDWVHYPTPSTRRGVPKTPPLSALEERLIRRFWGVVPASWIAIRLRRSDSAVCKVAARLGLPPIGRGHWRQRTAAAAPRPLLIVADAEAAG